MLVLTHCHVPISVSTFLAAILSQILCCVKAYSFIHLSILAAQQKGMVINMKPFLKWPGGKQWLINKYINLFPLKFNSYFEPFLGGASVFFALQPEKAILSDINEEIINLYKVMRDYPEELTKILITHNEKHSEKYYYEIRRQNSKDNISRAARTLYLNRMCFNGIYRVNQKGEFNVPIGTKTNCIYDIDSFSNYSLILKSCEILINDFSVPIQLAKTNDLLFADPPYTSSIQDGCFIKYNDKLFSWDDQLRLHKDLCLAKAKGVHVILTNKDNQEIEDLYKNSGFFIMRMHRQSCIKAKKETTKTVSELFITSYDPSKEQKNG